MRMKVKVTQKGIDQFHVWDRKTPTGVGYKHNCLVAAAVRELFPDAGVGFHIIDTHIEGMAFKDRIIDLPYTVTEQIRLLDQRRKNSGYTPVPFEFEIDVPMNIIDSISIGQAYKVLSESATLEFVCP